MYEGNRHSPSPQDINNSQVAANRYCISVSILQMNVHDFTIASALTFWHSVTAPYPKKFAVDNIGIRNTLFIN